MVVISVEALFDGKNIGLRDKTTEWLRKYTAEWEVENNKEQWTIDDSTAFVVGPNKFIEMLHIMMLVAISMIHCNCPSILDIISLPQMKNVSHNLAQMLHYNNL